jgi:hypothetical protein
MKVIHYALKLQQKNVRICFGMLLTSLDMRLSNLDFSNTSHSNKRNTQLYIEIRVFFCFGIIEKTLTRQCAYFSFHIF